VGLEREIKELDRQIKETRTKSKGAATLADKLQAQKEQRDLEGLRDKKRRELFNRQDEIQARRDKLIEELEAQLGQKSHSEHCLAVNGRLHDRANNNMPAPQDWLRNRNAIEFSEEAWRICDI
jgi:F0F1-type ATP synthase membrane subunit b/b'